MKGADIMSGKKAQEVGPEDQHSITIMFCQVHREPV